ncbi:DNA cytosine methyltransferase [Bradyrhizobium sp. LjRoot220]|uniref:DNA cytosine methyltransferase n=1 Tax=Bradyrhizobium sp. LjRoot220 TaxID=3342284 RepID=UPI003ECFB602
MNALAEIIDPKPLLTKAKRARVADLFCGAGSLSMGINDALIELGYQPEFVAVNHWDVATQTYARNHPGASVHCVNLDAAFPSRLVPSGRLDLLTAGIECTYFSRARGGKPVNDQQRMSAWHVVRWCTELRVKRLLLENVPEFVEWGPVDARTGRPIKSRKGEYFRAWISALEAIGYRVDWRVINCADFGDATTRERLFILGWQSKKPLPWAIRTHAKRGLAVGVLPWRPARDIIDWSLAGTSIFDRDRPLAPKTIARIAAGVVKFNWPEPFIVVLRRHCDARGIDLPIPAVTAGGTHIGLAQPVGETFTFPLQQSKGRNRGHRPVSDPTGTITATSADIGLVQPFMLGQHSNAAPREVDEPAPTVCTISRISVIEPFVLSQASGGSPRSTDDPMPTAPTGGAHSLIAPYYGSGSGNTCSSVREPLPTVTTNDRFGLVIPVTHDDSSNRARQLTEPLPTLTTANRGELALVAEGREYDILFRMLQPHELAAAMSISTPERPYHFVGNKTEVVRQIGQAVPRRTGAALARALMEATL